MTITAEATYENGTLKMAKPLPLEEHARVQVTVKPLDKDYDPLDQVIGVGAGPLQGDGAKNHDQYLYGKRP